MGSTFKAIAGIALMIAAPGIGAWASGGAFAWGTTIASLSGIGLATAIGVTLVAASLAGSALTPELGDIAGVDSYSGQKLQTQKSNVNPVPQIFGYNRLAGNIIFQKTNAAVNADATANGYNRDYWAIIALAGHTIEDITGIYAGATAMTSLGSNKFQTDYVHVKWYDAISGSGTSLADINFVTNATGSESTGSSLGLQTVTTYSSNQVLTFTGNVDHELYIAFDCAEAGAFSYSATGSSSTLESGALAASCYYNEYGEWNHGDLSATINLTPVNSSGLTSSRNHIINLSSVSGRGTVSVSQQPSSSNNYRAVVYIYDGDSSEDGYSFTATFKEQATVETFAHIPTNTAFLAVHQVFDGEENKSTQMANLTVLMKGKKIRTITNSTTISTAKTYTTNPAEVVLDLLTDGLNIADANIDIDSFYSAKTSCTTNAWNANLAVMQQANIQSIISDVLATCRGQIVHSANKWKLKIDSKSQTIVDTLTDDDFINNSLNISMKGNRDIANKIIFKYINPDDEWLSAQVVKEDIALQTFDGQTLEKTLDVKGVTDSTQAGKLAEITLNSMRFTENSSGTRIKQTPLALSFATKS